MKGADLGALAGDVVLSLATSWLGSVVQDLGLASVGLGSMVLFPVSLIGCSMPSSECLDSCPPVACGEGTVYGEGTV